LYSDNLKLQDLALWLCERISGVETTDLECDIRFALAASALEINDVKAAQKYTDSFFKPHAGEAKEEARVGEERQARGYNTRGSIYMALGDRDKAEALLRKSVTLYKQLPGNAADVRWLAFVNLGLVLLHKGSTEDASKLLEETLEELKGVPGDMDTRTLYVTSFTTLDILTGR
jgi:tetratricopeptide (TPR) repeat protein